MFLLGCLDAEVFLPISTGFVSLDECTGNNGLPERRFQMLDMVVEPFSNSQSTRSLNWIVSIRLTSFSTIGMSEVNWLRHSQWW